MVASTSSEEHGAIFVATDFSETADEALRQAHVRAEARGAELIVCHVVPNQLRVNMLFPQRAVQQGDEQLTLEQRALQLLIERTVAVTGRAPEAFTAVVDDGPVYAVVSERAERANPELIVLGARGQAAVSSTLLGSVAERVLRYAHGPVLIARKRAGAARRILVATDLSDPSLPALTAAAREAAFGAVPVTALHCIEPPTAMVGAEYGLAFAPPAPVEAMAVARELAEQRLAEAVQRAIPSAELRVVEGAPAAAILQAAEELQAELIVLGTRGRTGLKRVVLGSVAEAVVRNAPCSVLAVRSSA